METKVCLVTGASSGIGKPTAEALAATGARVGLICRNRELGQQAADEIKAATGRDGVDLLLADLASLESVRAVAAEILERYERIDLLVNNAGVVNTSRRMTEDGFEEVFAVNHLAHFLLTNLLLERITKSAPARIVNVASGAHKFSKLDFEDLHSERSFKAMRVYGASKRANILFTYELARRLDGSGVTVNAVHPGPVASRLAQNNGLWAMIITGVLKPFFRSPAKGAETSIYVATAPELEGVTGKYFADCRELRSDDASYDEAAWRRLWAESERMVGLNA